MYYFGRGSLNTPKINLGTYIFSTYVSSKCDEVVKFSTLTLNGPTFRDKGRGWFFIYYPLFWSDWGRILACSNHYIHLNSWILASYIKSRQLDNVWLFDFFEVENFEKTKKPVIVLFVELVIARIDTKKLCQMVGIAVLFSW